MIDETMLPNDSDRLYNWICRALLNDIKSPDLCYFIDTNTNEFFRLNKSNGTYTIFKLSGNFKSIGNSINQILFLKIKEILKGNLSIKLINPISKEDLDQLEHNFLLNVESNYLNHPLIEEIRLFINGKEVVDFSSFLKKKSIPLYIKWDSFKSGYLISRIENLLNEFSIKDEYKILN